MRMMMIMRIRSGMVGHTYIQRSEDDGGPSLPFIHSSVHSFIHGLSGCSFVGMMSLGQQINK